MRVTTFGEELEPILTTHIVQNPMIFDIELLLLSIYMNSLTFVDACHDRKQVPKMPRGEDELQHATSGRWGNLWRNFWFDTNLGGGIKPRKRKNI